MTVFLRKIKGFVLGNANVAPKGGSSFFDLPVRKKAKIIKKAIRTSNEDQKKLVDEFDKQYCRNRV